MVSVLLILTPAGGFLLQMAHLFTVAKSGKTKNTLIIKIGQPCQLNEFVQQQNILGNVKRYMVTLGP